jgi:hypothetical protein
MLVHQPLLVVGGVGIALEGDVPGPFACDASESPEILLRLSAQQTSGPMRAAGTPTFECTRWAAFVDGDTFTLCVKNKQVERVRVELPRQGLEGTYAWSDPAPYPYEYPANQLLTVHALGVAGGALIHGAAIVGPRGGLLVPGPSGAGKTTMSRAAAALGARILSDERTIVRPSRGGGWLLGGTPWPGEGGFADNASVPLRGIVMLEQADKNELVSISPARALALLYRCHFPPHWDSVASERTLGHLERIVREVPTYLFQNVKGSDAARMLLEKVGGA